MKTNIFKTVLFILVLMISLPANSTTIVSDSTQTSTTGKADEIRMQRLTKRLEEIKSMTKKELSREEKKELRKEVKSIKKEMKVTAARNGVYLSVGAIIIIILLLILLL